MTAMARAAAAGAIRRRAGAGVGRRRTAARAAGREEEAERYDVLVVGGGPVGTETALISAMAGKTVAVADPRGALLGAPTGWVSKALRQAGRDFGAADGSRRVDWEVCAHALANTATRALAATEHRLEDAAAVAEHWTPPEVLGGRARFLGSHLAAVESGSGPRRVAFDAAFIAVGSASVRIPALPWAEGERDGWLYDGDTVQGIGRVPSRLLIQGAGAIGVEYAFIFRSLGSEVCLAYREDHVMRELGLDESVRAAVEARMQRLGIELLPGTGDLVDLRAPAPDGRPGSARLGDGPRREFDAVLSATGRAGCCGALDVGLAGCAEPVRGRAVVDPESMRCVGADGRALTHIYAVGDAESGSDLKPEGLLSTGLAGAYIATHAAFPEEIEEIGAPAIARASSPEAPPRSQRA